MCVCEAFITFKLGITQSSLRIAKLVVAWPQSLGRLQLESYYSLTFYRNLPDIYH